MKKILLILTLLTTYLQSFSQELEGFKLFSSMEEIMNPINLDGKPLFLEAYLPDCPHCKAFIPTFKDSSVVAYLKTINAYQLNMQKNEIRTFMYQNKWNVNSTPTFIFIDKKGQLINIIKAHTNINTPELLIKTIKENLSEENHPSVLIPKLKAGTIAGNELLRLAQYSKTVADTNLNAQVILKIAEKIPKENWNNAGIIKLISESMIEENNPIFNYMIHHLDQYYLKSDSSKINLIVENLIQANLFRPNNLDLADERLAEMKYGLQAIGIEGKSLDARFITLDIQKLLKTHQGNEALRRVREFYGQEEMPQKEKEYWCRLFIKSGDFTECPF